MTANKRFVDPDVHKDTIAVAVAEPGRAAEVRACDTIRSDRYALDRTIAKLRADGAGLHVGYEAGPTGFVFGRHLRKRGIDCPAAAGRRPTGTTPSCSPGFCAPPS